MHVLLLSIGAKCTASFMERCIIYIGENASECVKTNAFLNLKKEALIKLISSDYVSKNGIPSHPRPIATTTKASNCEFY